MITIVAISFSIFEDKLLSGEKRQTIRRYTMYRYNQLRNAKKLEIYWRQRSPNGYKMFDATLKDISIIRFTGTKNKASIERFTSTSKWYKLDSDEMNEIAIRDGFDNFDEMVEWFYKKYGISMFVGEFMVVRFADKERGLNSQR